jgi:hypothetical protein
MRCIIATAFESPQKLGLPYASWMLDRLAAYLAEHTGITIKRSQLDEVLLRTASASSASANAKDQPSATALVHCGNPPRWIHSVAS